MKNKRVEWLLPYRHVAPAGIERRMEALAAEGWTVDRIRQWHSIAMPMRRAEPARVRYAVELHPGRVREYRTLWESFGWELAGRMGSLFLWRMAYDPAGVRPEAYSDAESRGRRNAILRRAMGWIAAAAAIVMAALVTVSIVYGAWGTVEGRSGMIVALGLLAVLMGWVLASRACVPRDES